MVHHIPLALLAMTLAASAAAQPMSPQAFEAMSEGRTLHFTLDGAPFGAEQYFSGRRSLWRFVDGTCETGVWWDEGERICFRYGEDAPAQCWHFRGAAGGLAAALVQDGRETGFVLDLSHVDRAPLPCPGPKVGS
jgi:hypothetical protein